MSSDKRRMFLVPGDDTKREPEESDEALLACAVATFVCIQNNFVDFDVAVSYLTNFFKTQETITIHTCMFAIKEMERLTYDWQAEGKD